ncbi:MAG: hypothetical protein M4D80_10700 [Myxococcota bacterium]|nr:hypothetical protein [Deltaproteobacteria bacterium]MDQ3335625.1 hypothetical protein [Myxococcota bacterium]
MKVLILVFGILGVISLFIPTEGFTMFAFLKLAGMGYLVPVLGGFVLAAVMGAMGLAKPPMQQWQAGLAAAGFAMVFVRLKFWQMIKGIGDAPLSGKLLIVAVLGGLIVSILALAKPESKA